MKKLFAFTAPLWLSTRSSQVHVPSSYFMWCWSGQVFSFTSPGTALSRVRSIGDWLCWPHEFPVSGHHRQLLVSGVQLMDPSQVFGNPNYHKVWEKMVWEKDVTFLFWVPFSWLTHFPRVSHVTLSHCVGPKSLPLPDGLSFVPRKLNWSSFRALMAEMETRTAIDTNRWNFISFVCFRGSRVYLCYFTLTSMLSVKRYWYLWEKQEGKLKKYVQWLLEMNNARNLETVGFNKKVGK